VARILVVDDSAVVRRMLGFILEKGGHEVRYAENGEEGLAAVRASPPDAVFCDVEMPVMDGIAFVREMRADPGGSALPIIMLTANMEVVPGRDVRVDAFATKPPRSAEVLELVTQVLARSVP
jgi:two-component system response regulator MtrA